MTESAFHNLFFLYEAVQRVRHLISTHETHQLQRQIRDLEAAFPPWPPLPSARQDPPITRLEGHGAWVRWHWQMFERRVLLEEMEARMRHWRKCP